MLGILDSLSFGSATFAVAVISGAISGLLFYLTRYRWRWIFPLVIPMITAYVIYWAPVRYGADPGRYLAWSLLVLVPWSGAGILLSVVICLLIRPGIERQRARGRNR